ncbi:hypothetical protein AX769_00385 [Frondihabitans sp. PAMC 28766]|uniref:hypothetical protein n=1 Tax=Frondihabitans sp. PAMC 28766 TaxID=1795630 RepID=UPI00078E483F|nr:hypothetical protein [Frondihabitans sp. PAMC 28766]AMM18878.1 hypothetical protein AX769_00385 [Frondihabitans sp. PAMC 28766]
MERIHYVDESLLTGTAIAQSLLRYASALARRGSSATVDIPVRRDDGSVGHASFLLGPASQMVAEDESSSFDEIVDQQLVDLFEAESARLANPQARASDQPSAAEIGGQDLEF